MKKTLIFFGAMMLMGATVAATIYLPKFFGEFFNDTHATILGLKPARDLIVQRGTALVHGKAVNSNLIGADSVVHYLAYATLTYSVDLRAAKLDYDPSNGGVVTVRVPTLRVEASVDPRRKEKIASIALLDTEGGTGNELEERADRDLQSSAEHEARQVQNMITARRAAQFEIKELYEQPLRAMGNLARVEVIMSPR